MDQPAKTLVDLLRRRAEQFPRKVAFRLLVDGEAKDNAVTYSELEQQSRAIAAELVDRSAVDQRIALIHDSAYDFLPAFFGCLFAGAIPVPIPAPRSRNTSRRALAILDDARPLLVLSQAVTCTRGQSMTFEAMPDLEWFDADQIDPARQQDWRPPAIQSETLACLQYTSGSTRTPAGVMLRHGNFLANMAAIRECFGSDEHTQNICWLPHYHDMGLVGGLLGAIECGATTTLLSPTAFLQRPLRWLDAITRFGGTHSGGPNFAYDLCVRQIPETELDRFDLGSWRVAFNGAEPVQARTLQDFTDRFARCGFRSQAFSPCYGLAESTLLVTGKPADTAPVIQTVRTDSGSVPNSHEETRELVSSGVVALGQQVIIVDVDTGEPLPDGVEGEILVAGPGIAAGYWEREVETETTFAAQLAGDAEGRRYLKTGDLGRLIDGQLFVTGRHKDLLIFRGQNHYPQDIEATVAESHEALDDHWGAAISIEVDGEERLVIVHELTRQQRKHDPEPIVDAIRSQVSDQSGVEVYGIVLLLPGRLPRTSSGKVQRQQTRSVYLEGQLEPIHHWTADTLDAQRKMTGRTPQAAATSQAHPSETDIREWLRSALAGKVGRSTVEIDPQTEFAHYGLGSAAIVTMAGELEEFLGRRLSPTLLYEYSTLKTLSAHLAASQESPSHVLPTSPAPSAKGDHKETSKPVEPIAIVGMGCRLPGAANLAEFWSLLAQGRDAVRERPTRVGDDPQFLSGDERTRPRWGGYLDGVDQFDAAFFRISPREATCLDPQQRLMLEVTWEALEDAGIPASSLQRSNVGVFVGISSNDYRNFVEGKRDSRDLHSCTGNAACLAANRLSYFFDWTGPSLAIDTACSSSLVALDAACRSLAERECHLAVVGGVNLILAESVTDAFERAHFLASDGRCKAFDAKADGYVRGEGAGVIVARPLSEAVTDGDRIYAVICGTATNQDGRSNGLTAPHPQSQQAVIRAACERAGVVPRSLQYIEAHGTGTALGDPIEAQAIGEVLSAGRRDDDRCLIGSVKSNIGHLEAAAGVAGLIKTALMLHHETIVPSLHFEQPNPLIPFDVLPIAVATHMTDWLSGDSNRTAGVSSFGFGGTNAHAILTSAPKPRVPAAIHKADSTDALLLPLSAATKPALIELGLAYKDYIHETAHSESDWRNICLAAATNRDHLGERLAIVARTPQAALDALESSLNWLRESPGDKPANHPESDHDDSLTNLKRRYEAGEQIDWRAHYGRRGDVLSLPLYVWQRKRFWTDTDASAGELQEDPESVQLAETVDLPIDRVVPDSPPETSPMNDQPSTADREQDLSSISSYLRERAATALGYAPDEIDVDRPLNELGMDSLMAIELVNDVQETLRVRISFDQLLAGPSIADLAQSIAAGVNLSAGETSSTKLTVDGSAAEVPSTNRGSHGSAQSEPVTTAEPTVLSPSQERLWRLAELAGSQVLNIPVGVRLKGSLDVPALERALAELVQRHEMLRTTFHTDGDMVLQSVHPAGPVPLHVLHLSPMSIEERRREAARLMAETAGRPFDFKVGPVFRATLLRISDEEHWLGLVVSHLVADGASMAILIQELAVRYRDNLAGRPSQLPQRPLNYFDVARQSRSHLQSEQARRATDHWAKVLEAIPKTLNLPIDAPRPAVMTHVGARRYFSLTEASSVRLTEFSQEQGVTPFMTLLAAFQTLLGRCCAQEEFIVGVPAAGRFHPDAREVVGVMMTPLPLRAELTGDPTFLELLDRVREIALEAYRQDSVSLEALIEKLGVPLDPGRPPLFQVLFDLQDRIPLPSELADVTIELLELDPGTSMLELSLYLAAEKSGFRGFFEYNTSLFARETIDRFVDRFQVLIDGILDDPSRRLSQLPLLGAEEQQLLATWNKTDTSYSEESCIHELIEEQARRTPDETALIFHGAEISYRELNARANQLARWLFEQDVKPEEFVGICLERSLEMVIGMLGILKAGAAYVPIDPSHPQSRRQFLLEDSQTRIVLTQRRLRRHLPKDLRVLCLDTDWNEVAQLRADQPSRDENRCSADRLAYVIYTSGSTGRPKGVLVTHGNVVNFFQGITNLDRDQQPGTFLAVTTISFDISVMELLWTLARGFRVLIAPERGRTVRQTPGIGSSRAPMEFSLFYFDCEETQQQTGKYDLVLEGARFADQHQFTAVWTPERHFHPFGGVFPNPSVVMSAVAAQTRHIGIRAGSVVLPLHQPIRVAEDWAVVDNISGGRVGLAFAPGSHPNDFVLAPDVYAERKEWMLREIETVRKLWRGETTRQIGGNGELVEVEIHPRPVQPELPVWMTAIGLESFQHAGERGYNVLTHLLFHDTRDLTEKIVAYRQARRSAGHAGDGHVTLMVHTYVGESLQQVRDLVYEPLTGYLRSSADLFIKMGLASRFQVDVSEMEEDDVEAFVERAFERFFEFNGLLGTPESCATMVETLRAIGVDEIACLIDFGVDTNDVMDGLGRLNDVKQRVNRPLLADLDQQGDQVPLTDLMLRYEVTHLQCTPAMARMLLAEPSAEEALAQLETLYVGGDTLPVDLASELQGHVSGRVLNMYGPTETTVWSTTYQLPQRPRNVSIGTPIANTRLYVLDGSQRLVPIGTVGELYIGGAGVTRGYWQRGELTRERFLPDLFSSRNTDRMYRTGDQVRFRSDGTLEFLGRLDHQVKIRGHRIELGEIEAVIADHENVDQCVVLARQDATGEKQLVAFFRVCAGAAADPSSLRRFLRSRLPENMVPSSCVSVEEFPLTPNRKIDRRQLLETAGASAAGELPSGSLERGTCALGTPTDGRQPGATRRELVKWRTNTERTLVQLWRGVLERDHAISVEDNFFELGGHSLQATMLVTRTREAFGIELSLREFFEAENLATLAALIDSKPPST